MITGADAAWVFTLGVFTFLSPCGQPMLPAYIAYYLGAQGDARPGLSRGLVAGLVAAAGGLVVFAAIAAGAWLVGAPLKERIIHLELVGGVLIIVLGILGLLGKDLSIPVPVRAPERRGLLGLFAFGALYAAVAAGCSAPLLIAAVAYGFSIGAPATVIAIYALGLVGLLAAVTVAIAVAKRGLLEKVRAALPYVRRVGGGVMVLVGFYLLWYWWGNGGWEGLAGM